MSKMDNLDKTDSLSILFLIPRHPRKKYMMLQLARL